MQQSVMQAMHTAVEYILSMDDQKAQLVKFVHH